MCTRPCADANGLERGVKTLPSPGWLRASSAASLVAYIPTGMRAPCSLRPRLLAQPGSVRGFDTPLLVGKPASSCLRAAGGIFARVPEGLLLGRNLLPMVAVARRSGFTDEQLRQTGIEPERLAALDHMVPSSRIYGFIEALLPVVELERYAIEVAT